MPDSAAKLCHLPRVSHNFSISLFHFITSKEILTHDDKGTHLQVPRLRPGGGGGAGRPGEYCDDAEHTAITERARAAAETERNTAENTAARLDAHLDAAQHRVADLTGEREQLSANLSAAIERAVRAETREAPRCGRTLPAEIVHPSRPGPSGDFGCAETGHAATPLDPTVVCRRASGVRQSATGKVASRAPHSVNW